MSNIYKLVCAKHIAAQCDVSISHRDRVRWHGDLLQIKQVKGSVKLSYTSGVARNVELGGHYTVYIGADMHAAEGSALVHRGA